MKTFKAKLAAATLVAPYSLLHAQVVTVPSSTSTVRLQTLDPAATNFEAPAGTVIAVATDDGLNANNTRNWNLVNRGTITGTNDGISLGALTPGGSRFENYGTVSTSATTGVGPFGGLYANSGATVINHAGATISSGDRAIHMGAPGTVTNNGLLQGGQDTVIFVQGGTFTQGATGQVSGLNGVVFSANTLAGTNAGLIRVAGTGLWVRGGAAGTFDNTGGTIEVIATGGLRTAVVADTGAKLDLVGGFVLAAGGFSRGLVAQDVQSTINARDLSIEADGNQARAANAIAGGVTTVTNTSMTARGPGSAGVVALTAGRVQVSGGTVTTTGADGDGLVAYGDSAGGAGGVVVADGVRISTSGATAYGARAAGAGTGTPASVTMTGGSVETSGDGAIGLVAITQTTLTAGNVAVTTRGVGSEGATARNAARLVMNGGSVTTTGNDAVGLSTVGSGEPDQVGAVNDPDAAIIPGASVGGASLAATGVTVNTSGTGSHGVRVRGDSVLSLVDSTVTASGAGANAVQYEAAGGAGTLTAAGSTLVSQQGAGIAMNGGTMNVSMTTSSLHGSAALFNVTGGGTLNLNADAGSTLTGAALTEAGSTSNLVLRDSTWNLTGDSRLTTLNNDPSQILFSAPVGGVFKTLTVGQYSGDGVIGLNTYLGGDGSPSDKLVIDGGTASGTSRLRVTNAGGPGLVTSASGIQLVDTINGGTTQAGAFSIDGRAVAGPYEYRLFRGSIDGTAPQAWYLRSEQDPPPPPPDPAPGPAPSPAPDPVPDVPRPVRPLYRPEVGAYLANQRLSGQMFVHSLHDRRGEPQYAEGVGLVGQGKPGAGWLRMVGKWEGGRSKDGVFKTSTDSFLLQGGAELATWQAGGVASRLHAGVMGSYGYASSDAEAQANSAHAKGKVEGWSLGIYGTWYQDDEKKHGAYADAWFQYGWFSNRVEGDQLPTVKYSANGLAVSGEVGYAMPLHGGWVVEPQAQLIYVDYNESDIDEPNGTRVRGASASGILTRLGVRTHRTFVREDGRKLQPYVTLNWWYSDTESHIAFNQVQLGSMYPRNRFEAKVGMNLALNKSWSGWTSVSGAWGQQDYYQYAVRVGVRYAW